jgi:hypothetical protein
MKLRRFGLADAIILVTAAAAALLVNRLAWPGFLALRRHPLTAHDSIDQMLDLVTPHLAAGTIALLAMRLRTPRPGILKLARQPGAVACMVAAVMLLVIVCWGAGTTVAARVITVSEHVIPRRSDHFDHTRVMVTQIFRGLLLTIYGDRIGFAVAGAWLSLWLAGRWRAEPTWIDRLGRAAGWLWLVLALAIWLRCYSV